VSQQMKQVVLELLAKHGLTQAFEQAGGGEFHLRLENEPYMPLVIEKIAGDQVSVAHYFTQNGDAMRDPELTFLLPDWSPTSITQDPVGHYACVGNLPQGSRQRARLLADLTSFARTWARNIQAQGFADAASARVKASSLTHQAVVDRESQPRLTDHQAPDSHLEMLYEDRVVSDYEEYEPSPYDGTYSEE